MTKEQRRRKAIRARKEYLKRKFISSIMINLVIILILMFLILFLWPKSEAEISKASVPETTFYQESTYTQEVQEEVIELKGNSDDFIHDYPRFTYSKDWGADDAYLLAKIAMAEAEGCSIETKEYVILAVLNRVFSDDFPGTIHDVLYQKINGVYQFTPIGNGRWDRIEPNEECWEALTNVMVAEYDNSRGATYFESCENPDNWHSRNLTYLYESDGMRFYK